jgi:hypothetical protein
MRSRNIIAGEGEIVGVSGVCKAHAPRESCEPVIHLHEQRIAQLRTGRRTLRTRA